jgi:hypothetical protein
MAMPGADVLWDRFMASLIAYETAPEDLLRLLHETRGDATVDAVLRALCGRSADELMGE